MIKGKLNYRKNLIIFPLKVIVTFLNHQENEQILPNYRKPGYGESQVKMSDDFDILPDEIINTFME